MPDAPQWPRLSACRARLAQLLSSTQCEQITLLLVLVYGVVVLFDLGVQGLALPGWQTAYLVIDLFFVSLFMTEVTLKLFAFGPAFVASVLNLVDASAIVLSFVITLLDVTGTLDQARCKLSPGSEPWP